MVEVLKQPPYSPLSPEQQVLIIQAGNLGYLDDLDPKAVRKFEDDLYPFIEAKYNSIFENIRNDKKITDETAELIKKAFDEFKVSFSA
jgi:F-type H+-transporting ATPase subunit alpha